MTKTYTRTPLFRRIFTNGPTLFVIFLILVALGQAFATGEWFAGIFMSCLFALLWFIFLRKGISGA